MTTNTQKGAPPGADNGNNTCNPNIIEIEFLAEDLMRFSNLHSWYKHLPKLPNTQKFYVFTHDTYQPRYEFDLSPPNNTNRNVYWWFVDESCVTNNKQLLQNKQIYTINFSNDLSDCISDNTTFQKYYQDLHNNIIGNNYINLTE